MMERNAQRVLFEIDLCRSRYGDECVWWPEDLSWVMVNDFPIPPGYNRPSTNCLVVIPEGYGYGVGLEEFYVDAGLRYSKDGKWVEIPHVFDDPSHFGNKYAGKGWRWLCIHPSWTPDDNILTFLAQVYIFLDNPFSEL